MSCNLCSKEITHKCTRCGKPLCDVHAIKNPCEDHPLVCPSCFGTHKECGYRWEDMSPTWKNSHHAESEADKKRLACSFAETSP